MKAHLFRSLNPNIPSFVIVADSFDYHSKFDAHAKLINDAAIRHWNSVAGSDDKFTGPHEVLTVVKLY